MNRNPLIRKCLVIGIIISFLEISIIPSVAKPEGIPVSFVPPQEIFFGLQTNINISWDENLTKEIDLEHSPPIVPLNVSFWVTWGLFGRLINLFYSYQKLNANFLIDNSPWSSSSLTFNQLPLYLPPKENIQQISMNQLTIDLDYWTPAYELIPITIETRIEPILGPSGSLVLIRGTTYRETIYVMAQYRSGLGINYPEGQTFETPPLIQVEVPLEIYNHGNGKTLVESEVDDSPPGWNISLPSQLILEQQEEAEILVTLMAPSDFSGYESVWLDFTPHYYYNYSVVGYTYSAHISVMYNPP
ncbi:MAG TPA: hypothetical protein VN377_06760 [Candidatus Thermoplasmatota archaeon]|nr:hypothetical protein [Candidatus Thermoplasmatota archaeon]